MRILNYCTLKQIEGFDMLDFSSFYLVTEFGKGL